MTAGTPAASGALSTHAPSFQFNWKTILLLALRVPSLAFAEVCEAAATMWDRDQAGDGGEGLTGRGTRSTGEGGHQGPPTATPNPRLQQEGIADTAAIQRTSPGFWQQTGSSLSQRASWKEKALISSSLLDNIW